jgi:hypothetical protein
METENQKRIRVVLENAKEQLKLIDISVRHDLIAIGRALSQMGDTTEIEYFQEIKEATEFRISILKGQANPQKKTRGRPKKVEIIIQEKRGRGRPRKEITKE